MIPDVSQPINLGATFAVSIRNSNLFVEMARDFQRMQDTAIREGFLLEGDWPGLIGYLNDMPERLRQSLETANRIVARMYFHDVQGAWETQSLLTTWQPLNPEYLEQKIANRLDRRTLIATGDALRSLGRNHSNPMEIVIGVTATSQEGYEYMMVQEFGSRDGTIPARPLFFPVLESNLERYVQVYADAIHTALQGLVYEVSGA